MRYHNHILIPPYSFRYKYCPHDKHNDRECQVSWIVKLVRTLEFLHYNHKSTRMLFVTACSLPNKYYTL